MLACTEQEIRRFHFLQEITSSHFLAIRFSEGLGSFYGTIGGTVKDTDPTKAKYREQAKPPAEKANVKVNPAKKGTGYGYPHLCIERDPPYTYKDTADKYDAPMDAQRVKTKKRKSTLFDYVLLLSFFLKLERIISS